MLKGTARGCLRKRSHEEPESPAIGYGTRLANDFRMKNPSNVETAEAISRDQWLGFLAGFTRENAGAHARIEVLGSDLGDQVIAEDRPFQGISADTKDRENTVWITVENNPTDHLAHGVHNVKALWLRPSTSQTGPALEIEDHDGIKTLLSLTRPEVFALPAASTGDAQ